MTTNIDRAAKVIGGWIDAYLPHSEDNFGADEDIARALAADTLEYKVETLYNGRWRGPVLGDGYGWLDAYDWAAASLARWREQHPDEQFRIVARRVSAPWEVTDE